MPYYAVLVLRYAVLLGGIIANYACYLHLCLTSMWTHTESRSPPRRWRLRCPRRPVWNGNIVALLFVLDESMQLQHGSPSVSR